MGGRKEAFVMLCAHLDRVPASSGMENMQGLWLFVKPELVGVSAAGWRRERKSGSLSKRGSFSHPSPASRIAPGLAS